MRGELALEDGEVEGGDDVYVQAVVWRCGQHVDSFDGDDTVLKTNVLVGYQFPSAGTVRL